MKIILIRHFESTKNLSDRFATIENDERLTTLGMEKAELLASSLKQYIKNNTLTFKNIYCANSKRALGTAEIIAKKLNSQIVIQNELDSIRNNAFAGLSEKEIEKISPEFIYQLKLYRYGLFNSFHIIPNEHNEYAIDFEERVKTALEQILTNNIQENLKVIVLHRSSIIAILLYFARTYFKYPSDFSGFVQIDVGNICILEIKNNNLFIYGINETSTFLVQ